MVQSATKQVTLEEFLQLPETDPASEYIDGRIIPKPMPQGKHSKLQGKIVTAINQVVETQKIAFAFPELRCTFGGRSIVPDVAVFAWGRIPIDENRDVANVFEAAPDWTIEILSPDQSQTKVTKNILHCLNYQTQMGWLIDPQEQSVFVYLPDRRTTVSDGLDVRLPVPEFARDFELTVGELFNWLLN